MTAREKEAPEPSSSDLDIGPLTQDELNLQRELAVPGIARGIESRLEELAVAMEEARAATEQEARHELMGGSVAGHLRAGGPVMRDIWQAYTETRNKLMADPKLQSDGWHGYRDQALQDAGRERDKRLAEQEQRLKGFADLLQKDHPAPPRRARDATATNDALLAALTFDSVLPEDFLESACEDLRTLVHPKAGEEDKAAALSRLRAARPFLRRRAVVPEKHSAPFARAYGEALRLVDLALDGGHKHRISRELAEEFARDWKTVNNQSRKAGSWDETTARLSGAFFSW